MAIDVNNPYFRNEVLTASPEKLRLLLLEGCLRFLRDGRASMEAKDFEGVYTNLTQARSILVELISSMRTEYAPELCEKVASLYSYIIRITLEGSFEKDITKLDEAIELMEYEVETWTMAMEKLARERGADAAPETPADSDAPTQPRSISICG